MPAPAVIPALIAYTKVAVVKTPVAVTWVVQRWWALTGLLRLSINVNRSLLPVALNWVAGLTVRSVYCE